MKRLKYFLTSMDPHTNTYKEMYEGSLRIIGSNQSYIDYNPTYYNGEIGFTIT